MKRDHYLDRMSSGKSRCRKDLAIIAVAALIAGCSLQPVYERPGATVAPSYPTGDA